MSSIEGLSGESQLEFSEEQLDGVYEWHMSQIGQAYSDGTSSSNPLYVIKGCVHLVGAALSWFPGVNHVVKAISRNFISDEVNSRYLLFLKRSAFEKAYYLARDHGANLSLTDDEGKTLADRLLDSIPCSPFHLDILRMVILRGGAVNLNHPYLKLLIIYYLNQKDYDPLAELIRRGFSIPQSYSDKIWVSLNKLHRKTELPPIDLGPLKPYIKDLTSNATHALYDYIQPSILAIKQVTQIFTLKKKNYPLIYSKQGIGKTTLVKGLANLIAHDEAPYFLSDKRVLSLDWRKLISDINNNKITFEGLHKALINLKGKTVIFLDNLEHDETEELSAIFNKKNITLNHLVENLMAHKEIYWVSACNEASYSSLNKNPYIKAFFSPYELDEPSKEACYQMMKEFSKKLEQLYEVQVDPGCIQNLVELSKRYLPNASYPVTPAIVLLQCVTLIMSQKSFGPLKVQRLQEELSKLTDEQLFLEGSSERSQRKKLEAIHEKIAQIEEKIKGLSQNLELEQEILGERKTVRIQLKFITKLIEKLTHEALIHPLLLKKAALEKQERLLNQRLASTQQVYTQSIDYSVLANVISAVSGIPLTKLTVDEKEMLKSLELSLQKRVKGQEEAVKVVSDTVRRSRLGLNGDNRPRGSFLFLGPTGVGKTELAKTLAETLYGSETNIIRLDMSEYSNYHETARLVGAPPGYKGHETGGQLTNALKKTPSCIVLVDEIEKAYPTVLDIFLQILDDGRLTDGQGETVNCKDAIFIMTSNIGADVYSLPKAEQKEGLDKALKAKLRPEFINRFDEILQFNALDNKAIIRKIALLQLESLQEKIEKLFRVSVSWNEDVVQFLTDKGFNPLFGARPLRHLVEKDLMTLISNALLEERLQEGQTATFEVQKGKVVLMHSSQR
ncbi:MAG: ATP-dependent Clp protease ATP-binding subunit [Simkaniaceae bacterium]|nr:MAG: ATP-dependent Clp protease ATP-binding subunit [Simkaniaceae bacterium]